MCAVHEEEVAGEACESGSGQHQAQLGDGEPDARLLGEVLQVLGC